MGTEVGTLILQQILMVTGKNPVDISGLFHHLFGSREEVLNEETRRILGSIELSSTSKWFERLIYLCFLSIHRLHPASFAGNLMAESPTYFQNKANNRLVKAGANNLSGFRVTVFRPGGDPFWIY